ncbi:MAG: type VI secretion system baseplate subunit TssK [Paracraurococcus sp.]
MTRAPHEAEVTLPDAVQWHEGMLLSPQHFQLAAQRAEALLAYHLATARPLFWGVRHLVIETTALAAGVFRVDALQAVLPDALPVAFEQGAGLDGPLSLDLPEAPSGTLTVHLAVARAGQAAAARGGRARFRSVGGPAVADENTGEDPVEIPRLRPNLLLLGTAGPHLPPGERLVSLPLARLLVGDQGWALDPDYDPPRPLVAPGTALQARVTGILRAVRAKVLSLSDRLQARREEEDAPAQELRQAAAVMTRLLPRLEVQAAGGQAHPLDLYLGLCDAVAELASLAPTPLPPELPAYDHLDPLDCFRQVLDRIAAALDALREPYRALRFQREAEGRFAIALQPDWLAPSLVIGARLAAGQDPTRVAAWLQAAIIASDSRMRAAAETRSRGAARTAIAEDPAIGLGPSSRLLLLRVAAEPAVVLPGEPLRVTGGAGALAADAPQSLLLFLPARRPDTLPDSVGPAA